MADVHRRLRFHDFELDTASGELRRNGLVLPLEPQPARLLVALASRAGALVPKDQLRREVWGSSVFVDFEQGLHYAVRQVRRALGDPARHPVFIETVARRGYRFIAAVEDANEDVKTEMPRPALNAGIRPPAWRETACRQAARLFAAAAAIVLMLSLPGRPSHSAESAAECRRDHDAAMTLLRATHTLVFGASAAQSPHHRLARDVAKAVHDLVF
jgi:DNA-binding winged helix-turn-helix (wHTH) protein